MVAKYLQSQVDIFEALVGRQSSMAEPRVLLVYVLSPEVATLVQSLCSSVIIVSPKLLLVVSSRGVDDWNDLLAKVWKSDPAKGIVSVKHRASEGARDLLFSAPPATRAQIDQIRARHGPQAITPSLARPETLRVTLSVPLKVASSLVEHWVPDFMQTVRELVGMPLLRETASDKLAVHSWRLQETFNAAWSGNISVQLATEAEMILVCSKLHGKAVVVQGHTATICVDSRFVDLGIYR